MIVEPNAVYVATVREVYRPFCYVLLSVVYITLLASQSVPATATNCSTYQGKVSLLTTRNAGFRCPRSKNKNPKHIGVTLRFNTKLWRVEDVPVLIV